MTRFVIFEEVINSAGSLRPVAINPDHVAFVEPREPARAKISGPDIDTVVVGEFSVVLGMLGDAPDPDFQEVGEPRRLGVDGLALRETALFKAAHALIMAMADVKTGADRNKLWGDLALEVRRAEGSADA